MLSPQTTQRLGSLFKNQDHYEPNLGIADQLAAKNIIMVVGATGEGKNTVMDKVATLDERFKVAGTRTSREPRKDDDKDRYTYWENSDTGLIPVLEAIDTRELVQYAVNPYAQLIYGSAIEDYPAVYNLADVFSSAVRDFRRLGFKQALAITLISQPHEWLERFERRFPRGHEQRQARRDEAIESFTWSLSQRSSHYWVENIDGKPEIAAQAVIDIALGNSQGDQSCRQLASKSLEAAWGIVL